MSLKMNHWMTASGTEYEQKMVATSRTRCREPHIRFSRLPPAGQKGLRRVWGSDEGLQDFGQTCADGRPCPTAGLCGGPLLAAGPKLLSCILVPCDKHPERDRVGTSPRGPLGVSSSPVLAPGHGAPPTHSFVSGIGLQDVQHLGTLFL